MPLPPRKPEPPKRRRVFKHRAISPHARLVESVCSSCRSFVGASARVEVLDFVEKLHICNVRNRLASSRNFSSSADPAFSSC